MNLITSPAMILVWILLSTVLLGAISFIGSVFLVSKIDLRKLTFYFVSLASGSLLGTAFFHLMPEALEQNPNALSFMGAGIFFFFILEKFLVWRHCHLHQHPEDHARPTAASMIIVGDGIHNFIDGIIIASAYLAGIPIGLSVTVAVLLHEIPQEIGDFGTLIHGGYPVKKALLVNGLTAMSAVVGAVVAYFSVESIPFLQSTLLPVAAGGFLYIALADLIPQLHLQVRLRQTLGQIALLAIGFGVMMTFAHH